VEFIELLGWAMKSGVIDEVDLRHSSTSSTQAQHSPTRRRSGRCVAAAPAQPWIGLRRRGESPRSR
jgi:hypothetical protein